MAVCVVELRLGRPPTEAITEEEVTQPGLSQGCLQRLLVELARVPGKRLRADINQHLDTVRLEQLEKPPNRDV